MRSFLAMPNIESRDICHAWRLSILSQCIMIESHMPTPTPYATCKLTSRRMPHAISRKLRNCYHKSRLLKIEWAQNIASSQSGELVLICNILKKEAKTKEHRQLLLPTVHHDLSGRSPTLRLKRAQRQRSTLYTNAHRTVS